MQVLQLPLSPSSMSPKSSTSSLEDIFSQPVTQPKSPEQFQTATSAHKREGAFPPSVLLSAGPPTTNANSTATNLDDHASDKAIAPDANVAKPTQTPSPVDDHQPSTKDAQSNEDTITKEGLTLNRSDSWINITPSSSSRVSSTSSDLGKRASINSTPSRSLPSHDHTGSTPSPPPKSPKSPRVFNALKSLKRLSSSLPRTPSIISGKSSNGPRTPSPSAPPFIPVPIQIQKIKSSWPAAMQSSDIYNMRTTSDRCTAYAQKINELYIYDCGLGDWLADVKYRGARSQRSPTGNVTVPPGLSGNAQPRQTSRSSAISEVTFPRRLDASAATDLSIKPNDDNTPPNAPPPLPYPALAHTPLVRSLSSANPSVMRSLGTTNGSSKTGGFFASLGRKASVKKERNNSVTSNSQASPLGKSLTKTPLKNAVSRPINIVTAPSIPGGPRAVPHRAQRSRTIMISSPSPRSFDKNSPINRRSSLKYDRVIDIQSDPEFVRQVDKLADLLPRADRHILAGYLRRAGQDILAIGQYLEDERNGTIRTD
jgi:hypothetical protein